jgi:hypothetical protein
MGKVSKMAVYLAIAIIAFFGLIAVLLSFSLKQPTGDMFGGALLLTFYSLICLRLFADAARWFSARAVFGLAFVMAAVIAFIFVGVAAFVAPGILTHFALLSVEPTVAVLQTALFLAVLHAVAATWAIHLHRKNQWWDIQNANDD